MFARMSLVSQKILKEKEQKRHTIVVCLPQVCMQKIVQLSIFTGKKILTRPGVKNCLMTTQCFCSPEQITADTITTPVLNTCYCDIHAYSRRQSKI